MALLSFATSVFWVSPLVPWATTIATVAPSILFWNRLMSAETQEEPVKARAAAASA
jgi:hypothetical protein